MALSLVSTWHPLRAPALRLRFHARRFVYRSALEERTVIESYDSSLNGNGRAIKLEQISREGKSGKMDPYLGSANGNGNGNGNGGMIKYEVENGNALKSGSILESEERERKKRVEEIGREDAWFRKDGEQPQVNIFTYKILSIYCKSL